MHKVEIPAWAVERALARRGRLHPFDDVDPARTALVVVDLQNGFMAPGQPAEVVQAREIVPNVNRLARATRAAGGAVMWIQNTITPETEKSWSVWFGHFAREEWGPRMRQAFTPGNFGHALYPELDVAQGDLRVRKTRFSALSRAPPISTRSCAPAASTLWSSSAPRRMSAASRRRATR